jgi:hypothetical protein
MGFWAQNDQKQIEVLASARTRDVSEAVCVQNPTAGAANLDQIAPLFAPKPDGLLRKSRRNYDSKLSRVKISSVYESTA